MNTRNQRIQKIIFIVAMLCGLVVLIAGCEFDDDSTNSVTIYPTSALLDASKTNIVEFTAEGGNRDYAWSMNNNALGALYTASTNDASVLYVNNTNTGTNLITVRDSSGDSANARIVQN
jgi:hypothetical protein